MELAKVNVAGNLQSLPNPASVAVDNQRISAGSTPECRQIRLCRALTDIPVERYGVWYGFWGREQAGAGMCRPR